MPYPAYPVLDGLRLLERVARYAAPVPAETPDVPPIPVSVNCELDAEETVPGPVVVLQVPVPPKPVTNTC